MSTRKITFFAIILFSITVLYLLVSFLGLGLEIPLSIGASTLIVMIFQLFLFERINKKIDFNYSQVESLFSIFNLLEFKQPIPPLRGSVVSPDFANIVISKIIEERPQKILELGSGVSSLLSAYALNRLNSGLIYSLDHEEKYAAISKSIIEAHGLEKYVKVFHAPLKEMTLEEQKWQYYDSTCVTDEGLFNMLIVDGPPAVDNPLARYPALPVFFDNLASGSLIIVDDAARKGEIEAISRWIQEYSIVELYSWPAEKGIKIFRKV